MNTKIILPIFLAGIMILSILGFAFTSDNTSGKIDFNGYKFVQTNQGFQTYKNNEKILILSDPRTLDLSKIPEISLSELKSADKIYLTFNPEENLQQYIAYFNFNIQSKLKQFIPSCIKDIPDCFELPLKTCEDATPQEKIIQIQHSETPKITYENNCLLIQGDTKNLLPLVDALTLKLLL